MPATTSCDGATRARSTKSTLEMPALVSPSDGIPRSRRGTRRACCSAATTPMATANRKVSRAHPLFSSYVESNIDSILGWAGHWRGENATSETVICPLSYEVRRPLEAVCGLGWNVANGKTNFYWASDLLHRLLHIPKVGEGIVEHYAEDYESVIELAQTEPELSVRDSDTLQYFALEAYAYDVAVPGEGCAGKATTTSAEASMSSAEASVSSAEATGAPSPTVTEKPSVTSAAPAECHTHADGVVHCS